MAQKPVATVRAVVFLFAALAGLLKITQRWKSAAALIGSLTVGSGAAHAAIVTTTIVGTMMSGVDDGPNGVGVFGPAGSLVGKSYTLVFTFDDTKGQQDIPT